MKDRVEAEAWLRSLLQKVSGRSATDVSLDADLSEAIGLDSLGRLEVLSEIEAEFDFVFADDALANATTIARMLDDINRNSGAPIKKAQSCE